MKIDDLFNVYNSKSKGFETYTQGIIPFVTNGLKNNGIIGFVKPRSNDRVFDKDSICVSSFCEATVHKAPFLPRGNGGSGLLILIPKKFMSIDELFFYASYINLRHRWRFSYGRMVTKERIPNLELEQYTKDFKVENPEKIIPIKKTLKPNDKVFNRMNFVPCKLNSLFTIKKGQGGYLENLHGGKTPLVSATNENNGITDFVDLKPIFKAPSITVERVTGTAFVQLEDFVTVPDDLAVLIPNDPKIPLSFLFFVSTIINQERWRYSYGRKLTVGRLKLMSINMPIKENLVDYDIIEQLLKMFYGWAEIQTSFKKILTSKL